MRLPDLWTGLGTAVLGGFVALRATGFAEPAGAASPRLFPYIIGGLMVLTGLAIAGRHLAARTGGKGPGLLPPGEDWMRDPRRILRLALVPLTVLLFGLLAPHFGTFEVALPLVFACALTWAERPAGAAISALLLCAVLVLFFTRVMRVPLPAGPLSGLLF